MVTATTTDTCSTMRGRCILATFGMNRLGPVLFFVISIYVGLGNILEWFFLRHVNSLIRHIRRPSIVQIIDATTDTCCFVVFL